MMLPLLPGLAERTNTTAPKSLIPSNLAILCGGMLLSIGGSTKHCRAYATVGRASARTFKDCVRVGTPSVLMVVTRSILLARHYLM